MFSIGRRLFSSSSVDAAELQRFAAMSASWWDVQGQYGALHRMNVLRVQYIRNGVCDVLSLPARDATRAILSGLRVLDVGCGGGLLSESLGRLGARVLGIDAEPSTVGVAQHHLHTVSPELASSAVEYRCCTAEELLEREGPESFDVVCAMEVVEHVADFPLFMQSLCQLAKPGAPLFLSTLNRTVLSLALGVVAAEDILGVVPQRTHDWGKFRTPEELAHELGARGVQVIHQTGVLVDPLRWKFWTDDKRLGVNYMLTARKQQQQQQQQQHQHQQQQEQQQHQQHQQQQQEEEERTPQ